MRSEGMPLVAQVAVALRYTQAYFLFEDNPLHLHGISAALRAVFLRRGQYRLATGRSVGLRFVKLLWLPLFGGPKLLLHS